LIAKKGSTTTKTYAVGGKTLEEVNKDMMKKGPARSQRKPQILGGLSKANLWWLLGQAISRLKTTPDRSPLEVTAKKLKAGTANEQIPSSPCQSSPRKRGLSSML